MKIIQGLILWIALGLEIGITKADISDAPTCLPSCYYTSLKNTYGPSYIDDNDCEDKTCGCDDNNFVRNYFECFQTNHGCDPITAEEASDSLQAVCLKASVTLTVLNPEATYSLISVIRPSDPPSTGSLIGTISGTPIATTETNARVLPATTLPTRTLTTPSSIATTSMGSNSSLSTGAPEGSNSIQSAQSTMSTSVTDSQSASTTSNPTNMANGNAGAMLASPAIERVAAGVIIPLLAIFVFIGF
ncbi:hypothetical protein AA313_de0202782 [Arthrobotrys entomopaga]|nr:hypothetical protein AA313_de0202782 [Arthrobotrys entomopaga]